MREALCEGERQRERETEKGSERDRENGSKLKVLADGDPFGGGF